MKFQATPMCPPVDTTHQPYMDDPMRAGSAAAPLTHEHMEEIRQARLRAKKVRRAAKVAKTNGSLLAVFSVGSFLFAGIGAMMGEKDIIGLIMGVGLGVLAWNELRGGVMLKRFEPRAASVLGFNQLALGALIITYAAWMLYQSYYGPNPYEQQLQQYPILDGSGFDLKGIGELEKNISILIYASLIIGTVIYQGLNALYYFTRRKHIQAYLHETPQWVVDMQAIDAAF